MIALHLTGERAPRLSRWFWLIKMFAAIPHFVILAALWAAFAVVAVIAAIAILVTGRFPRALFDFNVGVMRWSWRVGFYVDAALGTDRYPPFSLAPADYPATLDVAYPARLSRGRLLVKWLLAVPHLVVVWLLAYTLLLYPVPALNDLNTGFSPGGYSVINLLVVIAGFFLLITGRYPVVLFDFLVGISRWIYRVITYVAFMTDEYPPFRLDAGPTETHPKGQS